MGIEVPNAFYGRIVEQGICSKEVSHLGTLIATTHFKFEKGVEDEAIASACVWVIDGTPESGYELLGSIEIPLLADYGDITEYPSYVEAYKTFCDIRGVRTEAPEMGKWFAAEVRDTFIGVVWPDVLGGSFPARKTMWMEELLDLAANTVTFSEYEEEDP